MQATQRFSHCHACSWRFTHWISQDGPSARRLDACEMMKTALTPFGRISANRYVIKLLNMCATDFVRSRSLGLSSSFNCSKLKDGLESKAYIHHEPISYKVSRHVHRQELSWKASGSHTRRCKFSTEVSHRSLGLAPLEYNTLKVHLISSAELDQRLSDQTHIEVMSINPAVTLHSHAPRKKRQANKLWRVVHA